MGATSLVTDQRAGELLWELFGGADMAWRRDAACRGQDPDLWFPLKGEDWKQKAAQAVCAECPVKEQCLDQALKLASGNDRGIWGGLTEAARKKRRRRQAKA